MSEFHLAQIRMKGGRRAQVRPIGVIRSVLKTRGKAPKQGSEGAPDAWLGEPVRSGGS